MGDENVLLFEDFEDYQDGSAPPDDWLVEGGEKVWIEEGNIRVKANPEVKGGLDHVCTVCHK